MQVQSISASNFKSLLDFKLDLAKFTCLIGLNGAGKSTLLQFVDFLAQQVRGDLKGWLAERHWQAKDLNSRLSSKKNIDFGVSLISSEGQGNVSWTGSFNTLHRLCTTERIETPGAVLEVKESHLRIADRPLGAVESQTILNEKITFSYEGSVLSQLKNEALPHSLLGFKNYILSVKSLDLLSPEYLRQRTREASGSIGLGGQRLSAYLHEIGPAGRKRVAENLRKVYPQLQHLSTKSLRSGWKQLEILEGFNGKKLLTEARHINDGMLRLIALLAELQSEHRFLLFDEIENGVNPELVEFVLDTLISARQQVLVTTHSPLILNYLDDDVARAGVIYLYKTRYGGTRAVPFFSIPSLGKKLSIMGPGEAFADTNLTLLGEEIEQIAQEP